MSSIILACCSQTKSKSVSKLSLIAVLKRLGTAIATRLFVHMRTAKVFGLFLNNNSMDPLDFLIKRELL
jgi:hypothetical protein